MTLRKFLKIFVGLLLFFVVVVGVISINHPIILKWLSGTARYIGKPMTATVYTNDQINPDIKVFHVKRYWNGTQADYYLLQFSYAETKETRTIISINISDNYVGRPSSTNKQDYDNIFGILFQGEVGSNFTPFTDDVKGYDFNPQLSFTGKTIKLNFPPAARDFKCDSIRIEL